MSQLLWKLGLQNILKYKFQCHALTWHWNFSHVRKWASPKPLLFRALHSHSSGWCSAHRAHTGFFLHVGRLPQKWSLHTPLMQYTGPPWSLGLSTQDILPQINKHAMWLKPEWWFTTICGIVSMNTTWKEGRNSRRLMFVWWLGVAWGRWGNCAQGNSRTHLWRCHQTEKGRGLDVSALPGPLGRSLDFPKQDYMQD